MKSSSSKWLAGAGLAVLAIIVVSVVVAVLNRSQSPVTLPEGTPEGTVQRFLLAIEEGETRQAYDYLSDELQEKCTFAHFQDTTRQFDRRGLNDGRDRRITLESTQPIDDTVAVMVRITEFNVSAPFNVNEYSYTQEYVLGELDGGWRFVDEPWPMTWCPEPPRSQ